MRVQIRLLMKEGQWRTHEGWQTFLQAEVDCVISYTLIVVSPHRQTVLVQSGCLLHKSPAYSICELVILVSGPCQKGRNQILIVLVNSCNCWRQLVPQTTHALDLYLIHVEFVRKSATNLMHIRWVSMDVHRYTSILYLLQCQRQCNC